MRESCDEDFLRSPGSTVARIQKELKSVPDGEEPITGWLAAIHEAIRQHTEAVEKYQQAEYSQREQQTQTELKAVVRLPEEVTEYYRSEQSDRPIKNRHEQVGLIVGIVGVILALVVAGLTWGTLIVFNGQLQTMQRANESAEIDAINSRRHAREELRIAQQQAKSAQDSVKAIQRQTDGANRAWITIDIPDPIIASVAEGQPLASKIEFTNSGNSVARKVLAEAMIEVVKNGKNPTFNYSWNHNAAATGLLLKDTKIILPTNRFVLQRDEKGTTTVLPLSHDEFEEYVAGKSYIAVYAKVKYWDTFGVQHWTTRCGWVAQKPPPGITWHISAYKCSNYGDVDDR